MTIQQAVEILDNMEFPSKDARTAWDVVLKIMRSEPDTEEPAPKPKKKTAKRK